MIDWEKQNESPWSDKKGIEFFSYPNSTVVPYVRVTKDELFKAPRPLWITDIHPEDALGSVVHSQEGTYWIDLPDGFEKYLQTLEPKYQKKYQKNLQTNSDLQIVHDEPKVIDQVWGHYVDRLNHLAAKNGAENYTEQELKFRYEFYQSKGMRTLALINASSPLKERVLAVNVSLWEQSTVFDLACMINPTRESLPRSLGTFAILKNIEEAINHKYSRYDLLATNYGYKTSFGAKEYKLKALVIADPHFFDFYQIPLDLKYDL